MKNLIIFIFFAIIIISCNTNNPLTSVPTSPNSIPPVIGDSGLISFTKIEYTSMEIKWQPATDDFTQTDKLKYKVYYSTLDNIQDPLQAEKNAKVAKDWTENITSCSITGLKPETRYYINVVVMDAEENKTAYKTVSDITKELQDIFAPRAGILTLGSTGVSVVQINWTSAVDNKTSKENLQYKLVYSTNQTNVSTRELANTTGLIALNWDKNVSSKNVENLNSATTYYFGLLVKDEAGNMELYNVVSTKTKDFELKIYFQNGMWSYYITDIQARYSTVDNWTVLRTGYPYINPTQDTSYPSTSPQYTINKSSYWFRYKVVGHDWATRQIIDLLPGKIYKIQVNDNTFSYYTIQVVGSY